MTFELKKPNFSSDRKDREERKCFLIIGCIWMGEDTSAEQVNIRERAHKSLKFLRDNPRVTGVVLYKESISCRDMTLKNCWL